jgi:hypothetical protein
MPTQTMTVTAPNGKTLDITGDHVPTESELHDIFQKAGVDVSGPPAPTAPASPAHPWIKAGLDALPGVGAVVGGALAGPETAGLAAIPAMALGAGAGRGLRDLIAEGFNIDQPSSPATKAGRIALDTTETAVASAILPGLWEAIKTPGKTISEVVETLPKWLRPNIPPGMGKAPARILTRPAWQSWQQEMAPEAPAPKPTATSTSMTPGPILQPRPAPVSAPAAAPVETVPGGNAPPTGSPPEPAPTARPKSPQQLLNEEAIARRRAAMQVQAPPSAVAATPQSLAESPAASPAKPSMSSEETKVYLQLRKQGVSDAQAREGILAARGLNERFGLSTPTQAETEFPKGQRGKLTPKPPLTEAQKAASQPKSTSATPTPEPAPTSAEPETAGTLSDLSSKPKVKRVKAPKAAVDTPPEAAASKPDEGFTNKPRMTTEEVPAKDAPWYKTIDDTKREKIFAIMRQADETTERLYGEGRRLMAPSGSVSVGAGAFDPFIKAEAASNYLSGLRKGMAPAQAEAYALAETQKAVEIHNSRRPKDINWKRWEGTGSEVIANLHRRILQAIKE